LPEPRKDKVQKAQEKELDPNWKISTRSLLNELKTILVDKLMVMVKGQTSNGVRVSTMKTS
jgi:hypothetical protein